MNDTLEELKALIDYTHSLFEAVTEEWKARSENKINLKKRIVADIETGGDIYKSIMDYLQLLDTISIDLVLSPIPYTCGKVSARVKSKNSIEFKIMHYKSDHEDGKVPIIKCINDLFGLRFIVDQPLSYIEISSLLKEIAKYRYKCINSTNNSYKATHIYFLEDNCAFPWELQIWNKCDEKDNLTSHHKYKQAYTTWEKK